MSRQDYNPAEIEPRWAEKWFSTNLYKAEDFSEKPKKYILAELPYPSGKSLHIGHALRYTVPEVYSRFLRMQGYNVLFPMGWDAFGLPTEGYALKMGSTPQEVTKELTEAYKKSMQRLGYAIDWDREIDTSSPEMYKWTQWLFLQFYKHGLAEKKEMPVWWCDELGNLADEEILTDSEGNKVSERGGYKVEKRMFSQWVLKIPEYAEKLLQGLEETEFPDYIKTAQTKWIGKTTGANIKFDLVSETSEGGASDLPTLEVYTTRPDTVFGVTFVVLSAEHPLADTLLEVVSNKSEVEEYLRKYKNMSDIERQTLKEKSGVRLAGVVAVHPFDPDRKMPVFVGNYVLMSAGTGAVMGVPAHDTRDYDFAKKYDLDIIPVVRPEDTPEDSLELPFTEKGILFNSAEFSGLTSEEAIHKIAESLKAQSRGGPATNYKIRDWVFSRQHYWGEPIPIVYTEDGKAEPVVDPDDLDAVQKALPVELPYSKEYSPTEDGRPPLARHEEWVKTVDSKGRPATRETQTMPTWAGSSWYYLRYLDPKNNEYFADMQKLAYWLPVDHYFGGAEHTTVHLLYSRFWHKFFYDIGLVPTSEPYRRRTNGGLLLAQDGRKMSKRYGNVVVPTTLVENYGADATRLALCFIGPYTETYPWNENVIKSTWRLLSTVNSLQERVADIDPDEETLRLLHKSIKNMTERMSRLKMNTAVSQLMVLLNRLKKQEQISRQVWEKFLLLLAPFAPFLTEELWQETKGYSTWDPANSIHLQSWPSYDQALVRENTLSLPVQINGKVRDELEVAANITEKDLKSLVLERPAVKRHLGDKNLVRFIYIPGKIVSLVVA